MMERFNLLGMSLPQMETFFALIGEPKFRAAQAMKWIHHFGITDFTQMTNFSKKLQATLAEKAIVKPPKLVQTHTSADGTIKWLVEVNSGSLIETVFIPHNERGTLCVSSQAGCILDCSFCSTGKQGFNSNLTSAEIAGQVWLAYRHFNAMPAKTSRTVTNIVLMGMGEPLLNFDNVLDAMRIMLDDLGYGISKRKVTLSTAGVAPKIDELIGKIDVSLALSLHAPNDELRNELVPLNKKYPISQTLASCVNYIESLGEKRYLTIEYILIKDVNDTAQHANQLIELLKDIPCKINLIPFNPFAHSPYKRPTSFSINKFKERLINAGFNTTARTTRGDDIMAACGQLAGKVKDKTRRAERHLIKVQQI
jgi:23S rRNA (adenine2503-C2)-methyltransferase